MCPGSKRLMKFDLFSLLKKWTVSLARIKTPARRSHWWEGNASKMLRNHLTTLN
jgi:hypothetical protein